MRTGLFFRIASAVVVAGAVALNVGGCPTGGTQLPTDIVGDATAGQDTFTTSCARCHFASSLASVRNFISNDLGAISSAMRGITLSDQDIADLREFLATQ